MAEKADAQAEGALVKDSYYHDGARWERDIYRRLELSRNAWRLVAIGSLVKWGESASSLGGEGEEFFALVGFGAGAGEELATFEVAEDAAGVTGVEAKFLADVGCGGTVAVGELVEDARLGEGEGAAGGAVEDMDFAGVEAVELAQSADLGIETGVGHGTSH